MLEMNGTSSVFKPPRSDICAYQNLSFAAAIMLAVINRNHIHAPPIHEREENVLLLSTCTVSSPLWGTTVGPYRTYPLT
jgi:hypothetical protein